MRDVIGRAANLHDGTGFTLSHLSCPKRVINRSRPIHGGHMKYRDDSAQGSLPGSGYPTIRREIPHSVAEPLHEQQPGDLLTAEELAAFAQDIEHLINDMKYRTIAEKVLSEIELQETWRGGTSRRPLNAP